MGIKFDTSKKEDYVVMANLQFDDGQLNGVPCKIYLPERVHNKPFLVLKPSYSDIKTLRNKWKFSFYAEYLNPDGSKYITFESPEVHLVESETRFWDQDISDSTVICEPQDLHVVRRIDSQRMCHKSEVNFWISKNQSLTPFSSLESSYDGSIKYDSRTIEFPLGGDLEVSFEKKFKITTNDDELIQWSWLVARTAVPSQADNVSLLKSSALVCLDNFLLIATFATRSRTACLGWDAFDESSISTFYRGNYAFPSAKNVGGLDDGVVDRLHFSDFVKAGYEVFRDQQNKDPLRMAIYSVRPLRERTLESAFLSMFAGLESLILDFRRKEGVEFILPDEEFRSLKESIKKSIKNQNDVAISSEKRDLIYRKLGELNRISLKDAFDKFCGNYVIDLADLWPIFAEKDQVGLSEIRNRLIHGEPMDSTLLWALSVANEHLMCVIERIIVRIFGWDIGKTTVSNHFMKTQTHAINDLPVAMREVARILKGACS